MIQAQVFQVTLFVNDEGFWLAKLPGAETEFGEVSATPGEAVTLLLVANGVEVDTGAMVIEDGPDTDDFRSHSAPDIDWA